MNNTEMLNPNDGLNALKIDLVNSNISDLLGKILTIIDASISEPIQNKALKDLIKEKFSNKQNWLNELAWKELEGTGDGHFPRMDWEHGLVPFDREVIYNFK